MAFWRGKGRTARATGFAHIDGRPDAPWPPPRPRGVFWASLLFLLLSLLVGAVFIAGVAVAGIACSRFDACWMWGPIHPGILLIALSVGLTTPFFLQAWRRDKRPPMALGLSGRGGSAAFLWAVIGMLFSAPLLIWMMATSGRWDLAPVMLLSIATGLPIFALQGGSEEVICRGWLLQTIGARHGALIALIASSIFFALLHVDPRETPLGMVVAVVARLPLAFGLGVLALRNGNLWACLGLHAGWNAGQFGAATLVARAAGKSPWDEMLAANDVTKLADLLDVTFAITVACMIAQLVLIWWLSRNVRENLFTRSAERSEPRLEG